MITLRTPSGDKAIAALTLRTPSGDKAIARATLRTPSGDKVVFDSASASAIAATANPISTVGSASSGSSTNVSTGTTSVTASGGTEPYSYSWEQLTGDGDWSIISPNQKTVRFANSNVPTNTEKSATFRCTVTDARGRQDTADVSAFVFNYGEVFF